MGEELLLTMEAHVKKKLGDSWPRSQGQGGGETENRATAGREPLRARPAMENSGQKSGIPPQKEQNGLTGD